MIAQFITHFLPEHHPPADNYWVQLGDVNPVAEFNTLEGMIDYCVAHPETEARAYWNGHGNSDPHSAHVFFLPAGGLVLGLSLTTNEESDWNRWVDELKTFAGTEYGYWAGDCPPEDTIAAFVAVAQKRAEPGAARTNSPPPS